MKKSLIIVILCLFIILGCSMFQKTDKNSSSIPIQDIAEVLRTDSAPSLPNKWEMHSIDKYDDGFVSPSVTIKYINGVTIRLSKSNWDLSNEFKNNNSVMFGNKQTQHYYNAKEDAYVFDLSSINYMVKSPNVLRNETEKVLADLLKASDALLIR